MTSRLNSINSINRKYRGSSLIQPVNQVTSILPSNPIINQNIVGGGLRSSYVIGGPSVVQTGRNVVIPSGGLITSTVAAPRAQILQGAPISRLPISAVSPVRVVETHTSALPVGHALPVRDSGLINHEIRDV